jgi:putative spermidine/putrescine transport system ATP-binding protein
MSFLALEDMWKQFGKVTAVDHISLSIQQGEFLTLLGPSGCGKTTILRMVAGFEQPDAGRILLDGEDITQQSARMRPMGMVFQSYALFPHMTAEQNIAFGMTMKHLSKGHIQKRSRELLELVDLAEYGPRYPHQLSGGQQQRIALARALAVEPKVLLLDEPLSALDARVRVSLRNEIRRIQQQLAMTAIYVTHDQEEALAISDRIAVMSKGKVEQLDRPEEIYRNPRTAFAATFVGTTNQFKGTLESAREGLCRIENQLFHVPPQHSLSDNSSVLVVVRPEEVSLQESSEKADISLNGQGNHLEGIIELRTFLGPFTRFHFHLEQYGEMTADVPSRLARDYTVGQRVQLSFPPEACQVLPLENASIDPLLVAEQI